MELKLGLVLEDPEMWIKNIYDLGCWDASVLPPDLTSYGTTHNKKKLWCYTEKNSIKDTISGELTVMAYFV